MTFLKGFKSNECKKSTIHHTLQTIYCLNSSFIGVFCAPSAIKTLYIIKMKTGNTKVRQVLRISYFIDVHFI